MIYTIEELRHDVLDKAEDVYEIFRDFFGDDFVDLQKDGRTLHNEDLLPGGFTIEDLSTTDIPHGHIEELKRALDTTLSIVVWWPEVTVTNEHNKSIVIWDLFAKIGINTLGTIPYEQPGFLLKRSTYNTSQLLSGYFHSHIPHTYANRENLIEWKSPCLGRGPIRGTIMSLKSDYNDTMWMLFCQELSMYVTVESLRGVPYKRLEDVGNLSENSQYSDYHYMRANIRVFSLHAPTNTSHDAFVAWLKEFTRYYLNNNHLSIGYDGEKFDINMPFFNFIIDISNACIKFLNLTSDQLKVSKFFAGGVLLKARISGTTISTQPRSSSTNINDVIGINILTFKDTAKNLRVLEDEVSAEQSESVLLDCEIAQYILKNILKVINYRYKNEHTNRRQENSAQTYQRVLYL